MDWGEEIGREQGPRSSTEAKAKDWIQIVMFDNVALVLKASES